MENDGVDSVADSDEEVRWRLTSQRRYGNSMPDRDAATRRHPGMVSAGGNHDGPAFWQDTHERDVVLDHELDEDIVFDT